MAFAEKLKALRHRYNMTQEYVAEHMNLARTTIAGYESKNRLPSHGTLAAFARFFHVTVDYLLSDEEPTYFTAEEADSMPDDSLELLMRYRRLPIRSKKDLLKQLRFLEIQDGIEIPETEAGHSDT